MGFNILLHNHGSSSYKLPPNTLDTEAGFSTKQAYSITHTLPEKQEQAMLTNQNKEKEKENTLILYRVLLTRK